MGLFSKKPDTGSTDSGSNSVQFGRYTDRHKTPEQLKYWDSSLELFKQKKYLDACWDFLNYVRDPQLDNVKLNRSADKIDFEIIQGSKIVKGYANEQEIVAEAEIASFENKPHVAVMRKLLSVNYDLFFCKFALKDNTFILKFSSPIQDCSPPALYPFLKELANQSDKYDEVLTEEFTFLKQTNVSHIQELPESEKEIKYNYLIDSVKSTMNRINELAENDFAGARSFLLLQLTFKIYYLLAPEGVLLDDLRFIQGIFFRNDNASIAEKNHLMIQEFNKIINKPKDVILKSLYRTKATFAVVTPMNFGAIADFIYDEIGKVEWYKTNKYYDIQQAICDYIVEYAEFFWGMDEPVYDLFDIYWKTANDKFFTSLGLSAEYYNSETMKFKQSLIENDIKKVVEKHKKKFPFIEFKLNTLKYDSLPEFSTSFLNEMEKMNLNLN
jgi:hypothetical protein